MATTAMRLLLSLLLLWFPCHAVRFPYNNDVQINNSDNFTDKISLHTHLNHGHTNIQQGFPINHRRASNSQNLSPNYGQTTQASPFPIYKKPVQEDQLLNYRNTSVIDHSRRQSVSKEDSTVRLTFTPNIPGNLPQMHSQVRTQNINMQNTHKNNYRAQNDSLYKYKRTEKLASDNKDDPTLNHLQKDDSNLTYRRIFKDNLPSNTRQTAVSVEERSEQGEVRRFSGTDLMAMTSEEQELMLLEALHQKTNSSKRGFETNLADMLGKSESIFMAVRAAFSQDKKLMYEFQYRKHKCKCCVIQFFSLSPLAFRASFYKTFMA